MDNLLIGEIVFDENGEKFVSYSDKKYKISSTFEDIELKNGSIINFSLQKRIFSDKTEIYAKIHQKSLKSWDQIYQDYEKIKKNNTSLEYHDFLKLNFSEPPKK